MTAVTVMTASYRFFLILITRHMCGAAKPASVNLLIQQHREDAPMFAAQQADKCLEAGDLDGKAVWMRVIRAIEEPTNTDAPGGGQSVH